MKVSKITKAARIAVNLIVCFFIAFSSLSICAVGASSAFAGVDHSAKVNQFDEQTGNPTYASNVTGNEVWGANIFTDGNNPLLDSKGQGTSDGTGFVNQFNNISNVLGRGIVILTGVLVVARMAIRGVYEMAFRQGDNLETDNESHSLLLALIATGDERRGGKGIKFNKNWVVPMLIENAKLIALVLFIWVIMGIISSIIMFVLGNVVGQSQGTDWNFITSFGIGDANSGIHVDSSMNKPS